MKYLAIACITTIISFLTVIFTPVYGKYHQNFMINKLKPDLRHMQEELVHYASIHKKMPASHSLKLDSLYLYDISMHSNDNTAIIQAQINGKEIGLKLGDGGMVTCLMALKNMHLESKCFYQLKKM